MRRILANSSLVRIGPLQLDAAAGRRAAGCSRLPSEPSRVSARGDELLADAVDRRVGDLGEELLEVVVEQARPVREHGQRGVVAHRAHGLDAVARHRGRGGCRSSSMRVAEGDLALQQRLVVRQRAPRAPAGRSSRCTRCSSSHWRYGRSAAIFCLISSSSMMRPCSVSTRNMRPGLQAALAAGCSPAAMSSTPASEAMMTRPSLVT